MKSKIETYLKTLITENGVLYDAMRYSLCAGGKRLRPQITMLAAKAMGKDPLVALPYGAAIECIHTYSLIHDDLPCMDDDDLRRGKPTCHKKFGEAIALLAGDGLLTLAFSVIAEAPLSATQNALATKILAHYAGPVGMVQGQILDMTHIGTNTDAILEMYGYKTGGLFRASVALGAIAAGGDGTEFDEFAINLGAAFQIQDDILDVTATTEELGKPIKSDEKNDKNTIVATLGVEKAKELAASYTTAAIHALLPFGENGRELCDLVLNLMERKM